MKRLALAGCMVALLLIALGVHLFLPPIPHAKLSRLVPGTTRADAEMILGHPASIEASTASYPEETWRYEVPLRFGWVDVFFDERGRLTHYNYERF